MCDACVTQVALLPLGIEAAALELPELKRSVERSGLNFNGDGVDDHRHSLYDLFGKAILTAESRNTNTHQIDSDKQHSGSGIMVFKV